MSDTEKLLYKIVENNILKKRYIGNRMSHFSKNCKEIFNSNLSLTLKKQLIRLYFKETLLDIEKSQLINEELTIMKNVINARYKNFLNKL